MNESIHGLASVIITGVITVSVVYLVLAHSAGTASVVGGVGKGLVGLGNVARGQGSQTGAPSGTVLGGTHQ